MAVLTWPSLLPNVQRAGNARAPVDLSLRSTMPLGAPQGRQRFTRPRETCPVSLILDSNGLAFFDAYWHWYLNQGCAWVVIPLRGELGTAATYARFIGQYVAKETGGKWAVTMTAELENPPHTAGLLVCQDPTFTPPAGVLSGTTSLTIASGTSGATIYYTTDGSTPSRSSTLYTGPVSLIGTAAITVKALAVKTGYEDSLPATATYTFATCATPVISPGTGLYASTQSVTISSTTPGVSIYYTTNGTTPTTSSTLYIGAFNVSATATVKALAVKASLFDSAIGSAVLSFLAGAAVNGVTFNGVIESADYHNGVLYVGGQFTSVHDAAGTHTRIHVAAIDLTTGLFTAFDPAANDRVELIYFDYLGRLWIGGQFTSISGTSRSYVARYDTSQALDSFNANITSGIRVITVRVDPTTGKSVVWGDISQIGGVAHVFGVWDSSDSFVGGAASLGFSGRQVIINGGSIYFLGALSPAIAVYDLATIAPITYTPTITGGSTTVEGGIIFGGLLYFAGQFSSVRSTTRNNFAALDLTAPTPTLQAWNPNANALGWSMAVDANGVLYTLGDFTTIGGSSRAGAAAFDTSGSIKTGWNPGLTGSGDVRGAVVINSQIVMYGLFANPSGGSNVYITGIA